MAQHVKSPFSIILACALLLSSGCGKKEEEQQAAGQTQPAPSSAQQPAPSQSPTTTSSKEPVAQTSAMPNTTEAAPRMDMTQFTAQNIETLKAMNQGKDIEPLSASALKGFLPSSLAGMNLSRSDAQHMNMMGVNVATAEADYSAGEGSGLLELVIMDVGNMSGAMRMSMRGWTMAKIDRTTETGYEKTTTYQGYKALEEYDRQDEHGEFRVFAGDRFVVEVKGDRVTMEKIKQAMGQIDIARLAKATK